MNQALYGICIFLISIVIPFLHFFNEESESNSSDRLHKAIKYTFCFALLTIIFIVLGLLLPLPVPDTDSIINKIINLLETTKFQRALDIVLGFITMLGLVNISFYTASGLSCWPISLLVGTSSVSKSLSDLNDREVALRVRINTLQEKARVSRLSPRERDQLNDAENELADLEREETILSNYTDSWTYKLRKGIRPIQIIAGIIFGSLSIFLLVTLMIVNVDRILHGLGPKQAYILPKPQVTNPLEFLYDVIENYAMIGSLPLLITTCFLVIATISGIRNLGLWFLFARIHTIKVGRTQPQALLHFCITIMIAALAFNVFLYSLTMDYITFGNQKFKTAPNGTETVCTLANYNSDCIPTRSSVLTMRMMSQFWIFGAAMYWFNWVFVIIATISLIACLVKGRRRATHGIVSDQEEFED